MTGRFTIEANNPGPRDNTSLSAGFHPGRKGDHFWLRPSGESQAPHASGRSNVPRLCSHQAGRAHAPLTAGRSDITISSPFFGNPLRWNGGGGGYVDQNQKSTAYTGQSTSAKLKAHEYALSRRNPDHLKPESTDFKNVTLRTESTRKYRI